MTTKARAGALGVVAGLIVAGVAASAPVPITVENPSFTGLSTAGWTGAGNYGATAGDYAGAGHASNNNPADGSCAYMRYWGSSLKQRTAEVIDENEVYSLTADCATASDLWGSGTGLELYAWDGAVETTLRTLSVQASPDWAALSLQVSGADLAGKGGQTLGIKLLGGNADRAHFDNVRLTKSGLTDPRTYQPASAIAVSDFSFETTGSINGSWTGGAPHVWDGGGWPMGTGSYGQAPTDGSRVGANSAYQLLDTTFVKDAKYTLTVDASTRGDRGDANYVARAAGFELFREEQFPGASTSYGTPRYGCVQGTLQAARNAPGVTGDSDWARNLSLTYVATEDDDGKKIGIFVNGSTPDGAAPQPVWDNVRLTVELATPAALMGVRGGPSQDVAIVDGAGTPTTVTDGRNFGDLNPGETEVHTFKISSLGTASLTVGEASLEGGDAADFSITQPLTSALASGESTTFTVTFAPQPASPVGPKATTVSIANDGSGAPWTFVIEGALTESGSPTSTDPSLTATEDVETALAAGNFGYSDPNSVPLAEVQITSLPAPGTLRLSGTAVTADDLPLTVAAAAIGTLTYQAPLNANGAAYALIGIKVKNEAGLWSGAAAMIVNVTAVNDPPTSSGGALAVTEDTPKAFPGTVGQWGYADPVEGDPFGAVKVVALPAHGTLTLDGIGVGAGDVIPAGSLTLLTYAPAPNYSGADSFLFQVRDGADFSADATVTIAVAAVVDEVVMMAKACVAPRAPIATVVGKIQVRSPDAAPALAFAGGADDARFTLGAVTAVGDGVYAADLAMAEAASATIGRKYYVDIRATLGAKSGVQAIEVEVALRATSSGAILIFR